MDRYGDWSVLSVFVATYTWIAEIRGKPGKLELPMEVRREMVLIAAATESRD